MKACALAVSAARVSSKGVLDQLEPIAQVVLFPPHWQRSLTSLSERSSDRHQAKTSGHPQQPQTPSNGLDPSLPAALEARSKRRVTKGQLLRQQLELPSSPLLEQALSQEQEEPSLNDGALLAQHRVVNSLSGHMDQGRAAFARLLRRHNYSLSNLKGQVVQARVLRVTHSHVYVDAGLHSISPLPRGDLDVSHVLDPVASAPLAERESLQDLRVGDVVKVRIEETYTPYGDMQLSAVQEDPKLRHRLVWAELVAAAREGTPVQGRVLNQCPGGYAVGVSGFVALLPYSQALAGTAQQVGVLQSFYITKVYESQQRLVLQDVGMGTPQGLRRSRPL